MKKLRGPRIASDASVSAPQISRANRGGERWLLHRSAPRPRRCRLRSAQRQTQSRLHRRRRARHACHAALLKEPDVRGVAVCDVNKSGANYTQWSAHESATPFRSLLGVSSGWDWLSPDDPIQLSHTLKVTSGGAGANPRKKLSMPTTPPAPAPEIPAAARPIPISANSSKKKKISTPSSSATTDHLPRHHLRRGMRKRKHVFCQKPLTHSIYEARRHRRHRPRKPASPHKSLLAIKPPKTRASFANGSGLRHRSRSRSAQLVRSSILAAGHRSSERDRLGSRRPSMGPVARSCARAAPTINVYLPFPGAAGRFRLRCSRRYGLLQLRHNLSRPETRGPFQRRSKLYRSLSGNPIRTHRLSRSTTPNAAICRP